MKHPPTQDRIEDRSLWQLRAAMPNDRGSAAAPRIAPAAAGCNRWLDGLARNDREYVFDLENTRVFGPFALVRVALNAAQSTVFDVQHTPGRMARPLKTDFCVSSGKERRLGLADCLRAQ